MNDDVTSLEQSANYDLEQQMRDYGVGTAKAMASRVAHDFNNLIAVVRGYASVLQLRPGMDNYSKELVDCIDQASAELAILTNRMAHFAVNQNVNAPGST